MLLSNSLVPKKPKSLACANLIGEDNRFGSRTTVTALLIFDLDDDAYEEAVSAPRTTVTALLNRCRNRVATYRGLPFREAS